MFRNWNKKFVNPLFGVISSNYSNKKNKKTQIMHFHLHWSQLFLDLWTHPTKATAVKGEYADNISFALKGNLWLSIWLSTPPAVCCSDQDTGTSSDQTWHYTGGNYMLRLYRRRSHRVVDDDSSHTISQLATGNITLNINAVTLTLAQNRVPNLVKEAGNLRLDKNVPDI